jgi:hypothetical protein
LLFYDKCSIEATPANSLGVSKAYHNHPSKIAVMKDQFDHNHKKTISGANCAIGNLTQEGRTCTAYIFLHRLLGLIMRTMQCMKNRTMLILRKHGADSSDE